MHKTKPKAHNLVILAIIKQSMSSSKYMESSAEKNKIDSYRSLCFLN